MECDAVVPEDIQSILNEHKSLQVIENDGKLRIKCLRSGHEMPCQLAAVTQHITGKKYKKYFVQPKFDMEKYKDVIVPSNKDGREHQLFCTLTCRHMNNVPHQIEQHVNGQRFQRAFARWQHCQETGEVFKPNLGRKPRKDSESVLEDTKRDVKDNGREDRDDLSDLYPEEDFSALDISNEDDDSDSEANVAGSKKRKPSDETVSYQVKRTSGQKKPKSSGTSKVKKAKRSD